jgi:hypothetical protein
MTSNNFLDTLLSLFSTSNSFAPWLPALLFRICGLVLAAIGWNRHRVLAFLLFLISSALGIVSSAFTAFAVSQMRGSNAQGMQFYSASATLGYLAIIMGLWGLGHFVFRAKFAPPHKPEIYQP